ncbi:hypothetical protein P0O15_03765 [Methanotrichaceae archaeon Mx]|uniref:Uncharacterized protein n=1 Tax=Candidatus Methanocrinis natronophilus TaxID=3033396 RepID=A0ABT5X6G2_9EURY|nr:hypothetical protein [Candidatus Methanocrinis natronophilus]
MENVFVGLCMTLFVIYVPSQGFEEGVDELSSELSLVILAGPVRFDVAVESLNQIYYRLWCGQFSPCLQISKMVMLYLFLFYGGDPTLRHYGENCLLHIIYII